MYRRIFQREWGGGGGLKGRNPVRESSSESDRVLTSGLPNPMTNDNESYEREVTRICEIHRALLRDYELDKARELETPAIPAIIVAARRHYSCCHRLERERYDA